MKFPGPQLYSRGLQISKTGPQRETLHADMSSLSQARDGGPRGCSPASRHLRLFAFHEVRMNLPAGPFIFKRRFFHQVSVLEKTLCPLRSQRLLGADGSCLGAGNASDQYDER